MQGLDSKVSLGVNGSETIKEINYEVFMNPKFIEEWGDGIPVFKEADPKSPEWRATPVIPLDLTSRGYGQIFIKNEADRLSNPTGTIKDRAAWELATLYRDYARALYLKLKTNVLTKGQLEKIPIPRFSLITSGNEGRAIAECFKRYNLPPPKILLSSKINNTILQELSKLRLDLYQADFSRALTTEDIKRLSNNSHGVDITSVKSFEPSSVFYDWHVHESFNESPDEIYVPFGSGRLMENYLFQQIRSMRNESEKRRDPRLKVPVSSVISMNILGAEPGGTNSIADKLSANFKPFLLFKDEDVRALVDFAFTGFETGKYPVDEESIKEAYNILLESNIEAEPSAATSLALYLSRFKKGLVTPNKKVLIVNTGKGLTQTNE